MGNMSRSRGLYPLGVQTSTRYLSSAGYTLQKTGLSFRVENDTSGFVSTTEVLFNDPSSSRTCTFEAYEFLTLSFEKATKKSEKSRFFPSGLSPTTLQALAKLVNARTVNTALVALVSQKWFCIDQCA